VRDTLLLLLLLSLSFALSPGRQHSTKAEAYLGRAGDVFISESEFAKRFEMLPALRRGKAGLEREKLEFLHSLIAEKLFAQEAKARKLDEESAFVSSYNEIRKMLARDELYRDEVTRKVNPTAQEVDLGVARALKQLFVGYIYVERKEDADFLRSRLRGKGDFSRLQLDTSMHAIRDTATVIWGDADTAVEAASYRLKEGGISPVVESGYGFYIISLISNSPNAYYSAMAPSDLREHVTDVVRSRAAHARTLKFVEEFIRGKIGYSPPAPNRYLAEQLRKTYERHEGDSLTTFTRQMYDEVRGECSPVLNDTLVVVGNVSWTVGEVLDRLLAKGFTVARGKSKNIPRLLNAAIREWVYDELLGQEGLARHLDERPAVQRELEVWRQSMLAGMMRSYIASHVKLSEGEILSALHETNPQFSIPRVRIRELTTRNVEDMKNALDGLRLGVSFEETIDRWSGDAEQRRNKGVVDYFPISQHAPVGEIAWEMNVGERFGPIPVGEEYVYFELLGKDEPLRLDSAAVRSHDAATKEAFRMKLKRTTDLFLSRAGQQRGFDIYQESVAKLAVSPVPMMTFRLLGFGGRMFAAPFLPPEFDWVNVDPPSSPVIP